MNDFYKNKIFLVSISIFTLLLFFLGYTFGKNKVNTVESIENSVLTENDINIDLESSLNNKIHANISVPESLLHQLLNDLIVENNVKGIEDLSIKISSEGIDLSARYTLLGFIKIPAQFTLFPEVDKGDIKLSINNVKIANLNIKIDKIIEKWLDINEDIKEFVTYDSGGIIIDKSIIQVAQVEEISLTDGFFNLKLEINKKTST